MKITQLNIVAKQFDATLHFYRLLGLDIQDPKAEPPGALHAVSESSAGLLLEIDNEHLAGIYNAGVRKGSTTGSVAIGVTFDTRSEVDAAFSRLVGAGFVARQQPYDAFWGSRFAVVADPEGNDVNLMSPPDPASISWPPANSPG